MIDELVVIWKEVVVASTCLGNMEENFPKNPGLQISRPRFERSTSLLIIDTLAHSDIAYLTTSSQLLPLRRDQQVGYNLQIEKFLTC
jgi:hypothetical protein